MRRGSRARPARPRQTPVPAPEPGLELLLEALEAEQDPATRSSFVMAWRAMEAARVPAKRAQLADDLMARLVEAIELGPDDDDDDDDDWEDRFIASAPFPPPAPRGAPLSSPRTRAGFGATWWGKAWIEALEQRARLDPNRLPRGRSYARGGAVGELTVDPGEVRAPVQGSRSRPYTVRLRVRRFTDDEWERVLGAVASRAAHTAALLDGELDPAIVEDMAQTGVALLPVAGEVEPSCSCPDWANPCKHSAAVCYLVADKLDDDPFTLLRLRGRPRDQVMAAVRRLRSATAGVPAAIPTVDAGRPVDAGVEARALWGSPVPAEPPLLPSAPMPPAQAGAPASLAIDLPADAPVNGDVLAGLAADAARRAWELSRGSGDGDLGLTVEEDLARIAAQRLGQPGFDDFAALSGLRPRALLRLALAWRAGGAAALEVLDGAPWYPPAWAMQEGVLVMEEAFAQATLRGERVTNSVAGVQLRYGRDGLWYLAERRSGLWEIQAPPLADPRALVRGVVAPG